MRAGWSVFAAVLRHPRLWPVAVRVGARAAGEGWWRRPPFLPVPSREYVRFRMMTQYGDPDAVPRADDVVGYLDWCRRFP